MSNIDFFLGIFLIINLLIFLKGAYETIKKKNSYGWTLGLYPLGIFFWGDAVIFGLFWVIASAISLLLEDWNLFRLIFSVFWVVRSLGEITYWLNQQFSTINRCPPEKLPGIKLFHNDSIWFIYQICWQCVAVAAIISSIYFAKIWLGQF